MMDETEKKVWFFYGLFVVLGLIFFIAISLTATRCSRHGAEKFRITNVFSLI